jgi:hypothetical protein
MTSRIVILVAALLTSMSSTYADKQITIDLVNCGEIDAAPSIGQQDEPQTVNGHVNVMDALENPKFKPGCPDVLAKIGTRFGIQVLVHGEKKGHVLHDLTTRVTHPPITNPATKKTSTTDEWQSPMNIEIPRFAGWQFEDTWELIPGKWKIEIMHKGESLVSKEFTVETVDSIR